MLHHVVLESSILLCFIKVHWKHVGLVDGNRFSIQ